MDERVNGPIGVPGGGKSASGPPVMGVPGAGQNADPDELLQGIDDELLALDSMATADQVKVYDRVHGTLSDALARTADTGVPPPGDPGA